MHIAVSLWAVIVVWRRGIWRNWNQYHPTMMYIAIGNLLYNFLTANYFLWKLKPDFLPNHSMTEMIYTFITFPATVLLFLANYPQKSSKIIMHYLQWLGIYFGVEWIFSLCGRMLYQHEWTLGWSFIFDITMFPMLRLHYKKPLLAYAISAVMCIFWIWLFHVPVGVPIGQRGG